MKGKLYRILMTISHYYGWHYAPDNKFIEAGYNFRWCKWCGTRSKDYIIHTQKGHKCDSSCVVNYETK